MKKPLLVALLLGIIALMLTFAYLNSLEQEYKGHTEKVKVLVAKKYIDQGEFIDPTMVEVKLVPKEYIQPRAVTTSGDLVSKTGKPTFMTMVPIEKGEQVVTTKLLTLGVETGIAALTPVHMRAITLRDVGELSMLKPGNRVDVVALVEYQDERGAQIKSAHTILQNVLVIAVGENVYGGINESMVKNLPGSDKQPAVALRQQEDLRTITLALSPKDVEVISLALYYGKIVLSLRALGDNMPYDAPGMRMNEILKEPKATMLGGSSQEDQQKIAMAQKYLAETKKQQEEALKLLSKYGKR